MFCSNCGYKHDSNLKFCPMCGNNIGITANNPSQQSVVPQQTVQLVSQQPASNQPVMMSQPVAQQLQSQQPMVNNNVPQPSYPVNNMNSNNGYGYNGNTHQTKKSKARLIIVCVTVIVAIILIIGVFLKLNGKETRDYEENTRTVMIYMVGSNLEAENAIATGDIGSIKADEVDLEHVNVLLYTGGTEKWHNFVSNQENAIYALTENGFEKVQTYSKQNMGSADTFSTFLNYAYDNYVTEHYDLIIYDHGGAIDGAVYDDFTGDKLSLDDFKKALNDSPFDNNNKLELVLFRTCLNGTIEVADVFDEYADYLIASSEVTLGSTFTPVLGFLNDIEVTDDAVSFGKKYIEEYKEQMALLDPHSEIGQMYSIIDLNKTENIVNSLEQFINGIDLDKNYANVVRARSGMFQFAYTYFDDSSYDMVDLYDLVERLSPYSSVDSNKVLSSINEAVLYNWSNIDDTHGLSIYFPYNGNFQSQAYFLGFYDDINFSQSYFDFINDFATLSRSNKNSSFGISDITENKTTVSGTEFELQLTEEQVADYAKSGYIIFHKEEDGFYTPILSSDNTILNEDGTLSTNISNNLIKVYDSEDESYVQLIERTVNGEKLYYSSSVILSYFNEDVDISEWKTDSTTIYFKQDGDNITVSNIILNGDEIVEGTVADIENYTTIQFWNFRYQILDANGEYKSDWDSSPTQYGVEFYVDADYKYKRATLDEGDYYCVFVITDIYGNTHYSKLLNVK